MAGKLTYSVIIPAPPDQNRLSALLGLSRADVEPERVEIVLARGRSPAVQRNLAIQDARGDLLLFLDDDSEVDSCLFRQLDDRMQEEDVAGVGGPNLAQEDDSIWATAQERALTSPVGAPRVRARYKGMGEAREATEDDLILCNFCIRRRVFDEEKAFDERLYPNEENELFHRLGSKGYRLLYDPRAIVYRKRSESPLRFAARISRYGRGRMEQTLIHPSGISFIHLAPLGLLGFGVLTLLHPSPIFLAAWGIYLALLGLEALRLSFSDQCPLLWGALVISLLCLHFGYALGLLSGLFRFPLKVFGKHATEVALVRVKAFENPFPAAEVLP